MTRLCDVPGSALQCPPPTSVTNILDGPQKGREKEGKVSGTCVFNCQLMRRLIAGWQFNQAICQLACELKQQQRLKPESSYFSVCLSAIVVDALCSSVLQVFSFWFSLWASLFNSCFNFPFLPTLKLSSIWLPLAVQQQQQQQLWQSVNWKVSNVSNKIYYVSIYFLFSLFVLKTSSRAKYN